MTLGIPYARPSSSPLSFPSFPCQPNYQLVFFLFIFKPLLTVQASPTTTFPVVTKVDDLKKDNLYLAIVILAALLFIVMIILAVVLILLRKNQQEIGIWNLFAFSFKFNLTFSQLYYQGNLGAGLITISFSND